MLERLQKVQNSAARLIFQCRRQNYISPLLMSLRWLPINAHIEYKLSVICHSFFLGLSPIYLSELLSVYTPKRNLRSFSGNRTLYVHKLRTKTSLIFFCSPHSMEFMPSELRRTDSILKFTSALIIHLFWKLYTLDFFYIDLSHYI